MAHLREQWAASRPQKAGALISIASYVLLLIGSATGKAVLLPLWAWLELANVGVIVALSRQIWLQGAMTPEHADQIKRVATAIHDSILANGDAVYRDGDRTDDVIRARFLDHSPEIASHLVEWESFRGREAARRAAAFQTIHHEGVRRWLPASGWSCGTILSYAQVYVERSVDQEYATEQPAFSVVGDTIVQGNGAGPVVLWLNTSNAGSASDCVAELQSWVLDMSRINDADEWRNLRRRRRELRTLLLQQLQEVMHATRLKRSRCGKACRAY